MTKQGELTFEEEWQYVDVDYAVTPDESVLADLIYSKEITLQHQISNEGKLQLHLSKRYLDRTDVIKHEQVLGYSSFKDVDQLLTFLSAALRKLNKKEV